MHSEDIFLCRNLLSQWAFELGSDAKSIAPPAKNNNYNLKQCFDSVLISGSISPANLQFSLKRPFLLDFY